MTESDRKHTVAATAHALGTAIKKLRRSVVRSYLRSLADQGGLTAVDIAALLSEATAALDEPAQQAVSSWLEQVGKPLQSKRTPSGSPPEEALPTGTEPVEEKASPPLRPGIELAGLLADVTDALVAPIYEAAVGRRRAGQAKDLKRRPTGLGLFRPRPTPEDGTALIALGGYGRREVCLYSDIDVSLLYLSRSEGIRDVASAFYYPLWDSGIRVGHSLRTPKETLVLAAGDIEIATALLDARLIAGSELLWKKFSDLLERFKERKRHQLAKEILEMVRKRRSNRGQFDELPLGAGSQQFDTKLGSGGLRELAAIRWLASLAGKNPKELVPASLSEQIEEARSNLLLLRSALHEWKDRPHDLVDVSALSWLESTYGEKGVGWLESAMASSLVIEEAVEWAAETFAEQYGLSVSHLVQDMARPWTPASKACREPTVRTTTGAGPDEQQSPDRRPLTAGADSSLLDLLERCPEQELYPRLRHLQNTGKMIVDIPEWAALKGLVQQNPLHLFCADLHSMLAACRLEKALDRCVLDTHEMWPIGLIERLHALLRSKEPGGLSASKKTEPAAPEPMPKEPAGLTGLKGEPHPKQLSLKALLRLSCLLHDIGKPGRQNTSEDHASAGAEIARAICERLDLAADATELCVFLVANHLLLFEAATRRDIRDSRTVMEVAEATRTVDRLDTLYLLSLADASATGPQAWNAWRRRLVTQLYLAARLSLGSAEYRENSSAFLSEGAQSVAVHPGRAHPLRDAGALEAYLKSKGVEAGAAREVAASADAFRYIFATEAEIALEALSRYLRTGKVQIDHFPVGDGLHRVAVAVGDRPGLFAKLAGAFTLAGMSVVSAQANTVQTSRPVAVDLFTVQPATASTISDRSWDRLCEYVAKALDGRLALRHRLARMARQPSYRGYLMHEPTVSEPGDTAPDLEVSVRVDNVFSPSHTLVEIKAPDRIGLLFDLASTLSELGCSIKHASVETLGHLASDIFYITDLSGKKIEDQDHLAEIKDALIHAAAGYAS
jgi:[protein-PII] uridylyltransferase